MQYNAARSFNSSTPFISGHISLNSPFINSRPFADTLLYSQLCGKKCRNKASDTRPHNQKKGDLWEETAELLLGTIVIKYKDYCKRECGPLLLLKSSDFSVTNNSNFSIISNSSLLLPVFSDPSVTNSSNFSVTSNSLLPLLVFSDPSVTNSTKSRFTGNSQFSIITTNQSSIAVSN